MTACIDHVVYMRNLCVYYAKTMREVCAANAQIMSDYVVNLSSTSREVRAISPGVGCLQCRRHAMARCGTACLRISCAQFTNTSRKSQCVKCVQNFSTCWKIFHAFHALSRTVPHLSAGSYAFSSHWHAWVNFSAQTRREPKCGQVSTGHMMVIFQNHSKIVLSKLTPCHLPPGHLPPGPLPPS